MKKLASNRMLAFFLACIIVITTCFTVSISAVWDYDDPGTGMPDPDDPNEGLPYPEKYQSDPNLDPNDGQAVAKYSFSYVPTVLDYEKNGTITTARAGEVVWLNIAVKNINTDHAPLGLSAFEGHVTFDVENLSLFCFDIDSIYGDSPWMEHFTSVNITEGMYRGIKVNIDYAVCWTPTKPAPDWQGDEIRGYGLHWGIKPEYIHMGSHGVIEDDCFVICMPIKLNDDLVEGEEYTFTIPYPRKELFGMTLVRSGDTQEAFARGGAYTITVKNHADIEENIATSAVYSAAALDGELGKMNNGYLNDMRYPLTEKSDYDVFEGGAKVDMQFSALADVSDVTVTFNDTEAANLPTSVKVYGVKADGSRVFLGNDTTGVAYAEGYVDPQYYDNYLTDDENLLINDANAYHYTVSGFDVAAYAGIYVEATAEDGDSVAIGEIEVNGEFAKINVTIENGVIENAAADNEYEVGTVLNIKADVLEGKKFIGWTVSDGGAGTFADADATETTFTVGAADTVIIANYENILYKLLVNGGTGAGEYANGTVVNIVANNAPEGKYFSHWKVVMGKGVVEDVNSPSTTVTTAIGHTIITAVYSDGITLTVIDGEGSANCQPGSDCDINATVPEGYVFYKWTVESGDAVIANANSASTSVTVNTSATVKAHFIPLHKPVPDNLAPNSTVTIENGSITMGNISYLNDQLYPITTASKWALASASGGKITMVYALDGLYSVDNLAFTFGVDPSGVTMPSAIKIYSAINANADDRELIADISGLTEADWEMLKVDEYPEYNSIFFRYSTDIEYPIPGRYIVVEIPTSNMMIMGETEIYGELSRFIVEVGGGYISNASNDGTYLPGTELVLVPNDAPEGQVFAGWSYCGLGTLDNDNNIFVVGESDAMISASFVDIHKPVPDNLAPNSDFKIIAGSTSSDFGTTIGTSMWQTGGYINDQLYPLTGGAKWVNFTSSQNKVTVIARLNGAYDISKVAVTLGYDDVNYTMVPAATINVYGLNVDANSGGKRIAVNSNTSNPGFEIIKFDATTNLTSLAARYELEIAAEDVASYQYLIFDFYCLPNFKNTSIGEIEIYGTKTQFKVEVVNGTKTPDATDSLYYPEDVIEITANDIADKEFIGWTLENENGTITSTTDKTTTFTVGMGNNTITANYRDIPYELTVINGTGSGRYVKGTEVTIEANVSQDPEKVFDRWVVVEGDAAITNPESATTTVTTDGVAAIEATYKDRLHALTVENGTGSGNYKNAAVVDITANEAPADKKFDHWEIVVGNGTFEDSTSATTKFTTSNEATTLRAVYVDIPYSVTVDGGSIVDPSDEGYVVGTTITLKADVPEHQQFVRWEIVSGSGTFENEADANSKFTTASGDTVIKAVYENVKYDLTVENGTGSGQYEYNAEASISATIPEGYVFTGWVTEGEVEIADATKAETTATVKGNAKVTATFAEKEYTLDIINGSSDSDKSSYKKGEQIAIKADAPEAHKKFAGWVIVSGEGEIADSTAAETTFIVGAQDTVIRAEYEDVLYTLTVENGTGSGEYLFNAEASISATIPEGYVFTGWVTEGEVEIADAANAETTATVKGNAKVTATFAEKEYTLDIINGGSDNEKNTYKKGEQIAIKADAPEAHKKFTGWVIVSGDGEIVDPTAAETTFIVGTQDTVIRAEYEDVLYTLTVENGTGSGEYLFNAEASISATIPEGYVFTGWVTEGEVEIADATNAETTATVKGNAKVTATFAEKEYTVDIINGAVDPDDAAESYKSGTVITIVADTAEANKHFVGWEIVSGNGTIADASAATTTITVGTSDFVVRANYADDLYKLTIENGTGIGTSENGNKVGTVVTITADKAPAGYVFDKWVIVSGEGEFADETKANTTFTLGASDTVIKAEYVKDENVPTGDNGLAVYGLFAVLAAIGTAVVIKKKQK